MIFHPVKRPARTGSAVYVSTNARMRRAVRTVVGGTAVVVLLTLGVSAVPVEQLLLGGVLTGVLLGFAGRQAVADIVAGLVLRLTRTIAVGDRIRLHNGALGGACEGTVTGLGLIHLRLRTTDTPLVVPHARVLAGAIAVLDPEAARPTTVRTRRPRTRRRHHPATHTQVLRTTRVMPTLNGDASRRSG